MLLAPANKTKRSLELVQLLLTFASFCTIVAASRIDASPLDRSGYHAAVPQQRDAARDRRFSDLARFERKRREAEQQASRRSGALGLEASVKTHDSPHFRLGASADGDGISSASRSSICAICRVSETSFA